MKVLSSIIAAAFLALSFSNQTWANRIHVLVRAGDVNELTQYLNTLALDELEDLINEKDAHGMSPLHLAAYKGNVEITSVLLEYGADVHDSCREYSAVKIASIKGFPSVERVIMKFIKKMKEEPLQFEMDDI